MQKQKALRELHTAKKTIRPSSTALEKPPEGRSSSRKRPREDTEDQVRDLLRKFEGKLYPNVLYNRDIGRRPSQKNGSQNSHTRYT